VEAMYFYCVGKDGGKFRIVRFDPLCKKKRIKN
jgi:hypothetical protein